MTSVGISDLNPYHETSGKLVVTYEGKTAEIKLERLAPLFPREPRQEIYRRATLELLGALSGWERSGATITWHVVDKQKEQQLREAK